MDTPLSPEPPVADHQEPTPETPAETINPADSPETAVATAEPPAPPVETPAPPAPPIPPIPIDLSRVAQDAQIRKVQVEAVIQLLDEGNTVPFITRYRRERTGGLHEEVIRRVRHRVGQLRQLADRKQTILKSIANQGRLSDELRDEILAAENPKRLEDLYLPYKPRKRSPASDARERGLEPLSLAIWDRDPAAANLDELLPTIVNPEKGLNSTDEIMQGVGHILADLIAEQAHIRGVLRMALWDTGRLAVTKSETLAEGKGTEFKDYFQFTESVRHIPPHRVLAINRGEKENALKVRLEYDGELVRRLTAERLPLVDHPHRERLLPFVEDALTRILLPSLEREIRRDLTERAQDHAIAVFARNLRSLLLQRPLGGKRVIAIDPGFRTGCKVAVLDESGNLLDHAIIHPHQPQRRMAEARHKLEEFIRKHQVPVVAIGNGTACRDTEELVAGLIAEFDARRRGEFPPAPIDVTPPTHVPATGSGQKDLGISPPSPIGQGVVGLGPPTADAPSDPLLVGQSSPAFAFTMTDVPPQLPPDRHDAANTEAAGGTGVPPVAPTGEGFSLTSESPPTFAVPPAATPVAHVPDSAKPAPELPPLDGLPEPPTDLAYVIVNEAGASDYATSPLGREEFPTFDAALRSAISIGRRLQDPLRELVKIDPQHVGVGLYQHDVHPKHLKEALTEVIESCVNHVGVDLNTAAASMLRHIAGLNQASAREIVEHRKRHGPFTSREQFKEVPGVGDARWVQAAGFVKVSDGAEPLDGAWIHPESYPVARQLLADLGFEPDVLRHLAADHPLHEKLKPVLPEEVAGRLNAGLPTVRDIIDELGRPGGDPREHLPPPVLKTGVLKLEDLHAGMELKGTVLNVVPFGAFIDVGLKDSGLVHISQMANRYIKSPHEVVAVGDVVTVWVLSVDADRRRASLTMIPPGTERKPPERRPQRSERPPGEPRREGRGPGGPPRRGSRPPHRGDRRPAPAGEPVAPSDQGGESLRGPAPPRPPRQLPERRPPKPKPLPNLTQAKKEGKEYLTTLGELAAFFKAREGPAESPPEQPSPE